MSFCSGCGSKTEDGTKFCVNCGETIEPSNQKNIQQIPSKETSIPKYQDNPIGLFKKLNLTEELSFETKLVTPIIFLKEVESKKLLAHNRQEIPISFCKANVYLTSERILFLVLYQLDAITVSELKKSKTSRLSGVSGTWFEIPLSAIQQIEMRPLKLLRGNEVENFFKSIIPDKEELKKFLQTPGVEIIYDDRLANGRIKDYMQALFKMGFFTRLFRKMEKSYDKIIIAGEEIVSIVPKLKSNKGA